MAQWVGGLATKPDDLGLLLRIHMLGENWFEQVALSDLNTHTMTHTKINAKQNLMKAEDSNNKIFKKNRWLKISVPG